MAYAVAVAVLRDPGLAEDATQEAYLRAFRRLRELDEPPAFAAWLRRIVITVALNMRRARRVTLLRLDESRRSPSWTKPRRAGPSRNAFGLPARCSR